MEEITPARLDTKQNTLPYNIDFQDFYHSKANGLAETRYVFVEANQLLQRWQHKRRFTIGETGFGTGLNFLATWQAMDKDSSACESLHYISIEKHPLPVGILNKILSYWPELDDYKTKLLKLYPPLLAGIHHIKLANDRITLTLCFMDVQSALKELVADVDCWYLDGFAPQKNPDMWTTQVMESLAGLSKSGTTLSTFTAASQVRRNMQAAGWTVKKYPGFGLKREMLTGGLSKEPTCPSRFLPWFALPEKLTLPQKLSATVIGGGIAGCQIARNLAERGWKVILLERHEKLAQEASGNQAGVLTPKMTAEPDWGERFYRQAFLHVLRQLKTLTDQGHHIDWSPCGSLQLNNNEREKKRWLALIERNLPENFIQLPDAGQASDLSGIQLPEGGSFFPEGGWINPASFCAALVDHENITVHLETGVLTLEQSDSGWQVNSNNETQPPTSIAIIANGRDAGSFPQSNFLPLSLVRGQTSTAIATDETRSLQITLGHEGYLTPPINDQHIFGATFERDNNDPVLSDEADQTNWSQLHKYLPEIAQEFHLPASSHVAIRTTTPDRYPYVGGLPDIAAYQKHYADLHHGKTYKQYPAATYQSGLFISTGYGSRGLTTSALCAELLACLICKEPLPVEKGLYYKLHPARFWVKQLKRKPS